MCVSWDCHAYGDGYVSFAPLSTDRTVVWYEPLETENVGAGTAYEVTSDAYRHITLASQRRTANRRSVEKDGLFLSTFSQGALGRSAKEGTAVRTTKMMHGHLPTAARMAMWGGDKASELGSKSHVLISPMEYAQTEVLLPVPPREQDQVGGESEQVLM